MDIYLALIAATVILVAVPGPNVALIVATTLRRGTRLGLVTVAGTTVGLAFQLALVVLGLTALIELLAGTLIWLRWAGVVYLAFFGLYLCFASADASDGGAVTDRSASIVFLRGLALAVINPKTLVFNAAFLPQFVPTDANFAHEIAVVSLLFLLVVAIGDATWALGAGRARKFLVRFGAWHKRLAGMALIGAAVSLAAYRRS